MPASPPSPRPAAQELQLVAALAFATAVTALGGAAGAAPPPVPRTVEATPVGSATALRLDGDLDDEVWGRAPAITGFVQREPHEGVAASFETEARVAYDASHLYVAVRAFDPDPARLVGLLTRRDAESPSDWIRVFVDSHHDRRTAYEFAVNPVGVKVDQYWFNDGAEDPGWDAVWDVAVRRDAGGWQAEFRIPFSQLRFTPGPNVTFGFAVARQIARLNETDTWPLVARSVNGLVSQFGELTALALTRPPRRLELLPYVKSDVQTRPSEAGNPLVKSPDPGAAAGLDLRYAVGRGLTLTATVNPDFGQVEADPAVVNLSAFETFFPERRPFFLESSGTFRFDIDCEDDQCTGLFYSRRIGRAPQAALDVPDDWYTAAPGETTILGAAKLTGRVGRFSIGALNALTAEEHGSFADPDGRFVGRQPVEPFASYTVLRARREFTNQSTLGFMATATNRQVPASTGEIVDHAYTGGIDGDWRPSPKYSVRGFWAASTVGGRPEALLSLQENARHLYQRPDATYLEVDPGRTSLGGHAGLLSVGKIGGERVRFTTVGGYKSPGFEINDLGFMQRADEITAGNWLQLRHERPKGGLRSFRINFNEWQGWNFGGDRLMFGGNVNAHAQLMSNWAFGAAVNVSAERFDDRLTRGGPGGYRPSRRGGWAYVESDDRRPVSLEVFGFHMHDDYASSIYEVAPSVRVRPTAALTLRTGLRWSHNLDDAQWIENLSLDDGDHYVFGRLDQRTAALTFRVEYTLRATLSLQVYAEPFVSTGHYTGFKELVDGRAPAYADRYAPFTYGSDADFRFASFRTTNVLRWEYRPGSALFVVWQQGREEVDEEGTFDFNRDFGRALRAPAHNTLLVKLSYWLSG